jgi:23S rRNA (pseudouridine1915-N3)-methyltransferase
MKIKLISIGKIKDKWIEQAIDEYSKRLTKFINFESIELADFKASSSLSSEEIKSKETEKLSQELVKHSGDILILDEKGKDFTSNEFAKLLQTKLNSSQDLIFVIGGAYGFTEEFKKNKNLICLSKMTFTHRMAKLIILEQIYRGFTIINNHPYHNN